MERKDQEINARKQDAITDSKTEPKTALRDVSSKRFYNEVIGWGKIIICALALAFLCSHFIILPIQVDGNSMYPTLEDGEFGLSYVFKRRFLEVERGDIVVVKYAPDDEYWVKRVIGLPNETISCKDDTIYIDGKALEEPYLDADYVARIRAAQGYFTDDFEEVALGEDEYFLMGDNRSASFDSRMVDEMFTLEDIRSASGFILFPFDKMKSME
ncbi:signal peptidase I [Massilicoli timonensis]|uniref:Signal peptidase I n=1 Tax=Massilicoli timonensis TaxID=2015901 RepID=A0ABT1SIK3_9FIRM|nr:signal peptidase I [Massilicoli timonensis]MCQ5121033.1 signal peptidase I [Massilicoli timonensis]